MEFLSAILSSITGNWISIICVCLPFVLPNKIVKACGLTLGTTLTTVLRQKVGKPGEEVEKWFQGTLAAFMSGLNDGLDSDDKV